MARWLRHAKCIRCSLQPTALCLLFSSLVLLWLLAAASVSAALDFGRSQTGGGATTSLAPGRRGFVRYLGTAADPCHERLLLAKAIGNEWAVCTPDLDVYVEDISNPGVMSWAPMGTAGGLPRAMAGLRLYRFTDFNAFSGQSGFDLI